MVIDNTKLYTILDEERTDFTCIRSTNTEWQWPWSSLWTQSAWVYILASLLSRRVILGQANYLKISLWLSFFIYKMGIMIAFIKLL